MKELTLFERHMRSWRKKKKDQEDQKFLDNILMELKKKIDTEKQQKIDELTKKLQKENM